jgi:hypothetical protein
MVFIDLQQLHTMGNECLAFQSRDLEALVMCSQAGNETLITVQTPMCMKLPCSCSWSIVHVEVKEETFSFIPPFPNVSTVGTQRYIFAKWHCHTGNF